MKARVAQGVPAQGRPQTTSSAVWGTIDLSTPSAETAHCQDISYWLAKRIVDVPLALLLLVISAPVIAVVAVVVAATSPGPILFRQKRLGRYGVPFECIKFRTMRLDAERVLESDPDLYEEYLRNSYKLPLARDKRVTGIGKLLRKTSLDELPQLYNVLKGEMSLVGPRPVVPPEIEEYGERAPDLLCAIPGITGAWQVQGRSALLYPERADLELSYVYTWSVREDLRILFKTLPAVLSRRGAH